MKTKHSALKNSKGSEKISSLLSAEHSTSVKAAKVKKKKAKVKIVDPSTLTDELLQQLCVQKKPLGSSTSNLKLSKSAKTGRNKLSVQKTSVRTPSPEQKTKKNVKPSLVSKALLSSKKKFDNKENDASENKLPSRKESKMVNGKKSPKGTVGVGKNSAKKAVTPKTNLEKSKEMLNSAVETNGTLKLIKKAKKCASELSGETTSQKTKNNTNIVKATKSVKLHRETPSPSLNAMKKLDDNHDDVTKLSKKSKKKIKKNSISEETPATSECKASTKKKKKALLKSAVVKHSSETDDEFPPVAVPIEKSKKVSVKALQKLNKITKDSSATAHTYDEEKPKKVLEKNSTLPKHHKSGKETVNRSANKPTATSVPYTPLRFALTKPNANIKKIFGTMKAHSNKLGQVRFIAMK